MATTSRVIGFNPQKLEKQLLKNYEKEQQRLLVEYAKRLIGEIGDQVKAYHGRHNLDRTGNLLDSLCWGLSYQGKLLDSGFYRPKRASSVSGLHEWSSVTFYDKRTYHWATEISADEPVDGRQLAEEFLQKNRNTKTQKWKLFFAILAPYWGYWELGFTLRPTFGKKTKEKRLQWAVMTQFHDTVKHDLKPARVTLTAKAATYASKSLYSRAKKNYNPE